MNIFKNFYKVAAYLVVALCAVNIAPSFADAFQAGVSALKRGHYSTAMRAWIPMAERGVAQAQNNVGHLYEEGYGVSQNYTEAMNWYKKAANQGLAEAQHNVGMLYYHGYGVRQNERAAHKWFNLAAQQDLRDAQYMLGLSYYLGKGVTQNNTLARAWFYKSAKQAYGNAQMMFAYMLQAGDGGKPQPEMAIVWALLAERNGVTDARDIAYHAELMLSDQQMAMANKLVEKCLSTNLKECS